MAVLFSGLRDNARTKMKMSGTRITIEQMLLAIIADGIQFLGWTKTKDAKHGKYKQKSILKTLQGEYDKPKDDLISFKTVEEYEEYMQQFTR